MVATLVGNLFFKLLVAATVLPAIMVVLTQNIVRAACWLLLSLGAAAGLFFYLGADFVGATQLLIYVGGTLVLLIFGVMLTATGPFVKLASRSGDWVMGVLAGGAVFGLLTYGVATADWSKSLAVVPAAAHDPAAAQSHGEAAEHADSNQSHAMHDPADGDEHANETPALPLAASAPTTTNRIGMAFLGFPGEQEQPHSTESDSGKQDSPSAVRRPKFRLSGYLLPFEIISVHLVVVLIGAAYLARAKRRKTREE